MTQDQLGWQVISFSSFMHRVGGSSFKKQYHFRVLVLSQNAPSKCGDLLDVCAAWETNTGAHSRLGEQDRTVLQDRCARRIEPILFCDEVRTNSVARSVGAILAYIADVHAREGRVHSQMPGKDFQSITSQPSDNSTMPKLREPTRHIQSWARLLTQTAASFQKGAKVWQAVQVLCRDAAGKA